MSYDTMDHAKWVEENIGYAKRYPVKGTDKRRLAEGRGWHAAPDKLNPFQKRAFTILGIVGGGIYNAPIEWDSVCWWKDMLFVNWRVDLSTYDFMNLTTAVFLAHDAGIRLSISPKMRWVQLAFHQRARRVPGQTTSSGHPTLEEAVENHRRRFPPGHHVHLEAEPQPPAEGTPATTAEA